MTPDPAWLRAAWTIRLLANDPAGLKGLWLRARAGPVRDRFLDMLVTAIAPLFLRRIHPAVTDEALFGGVDIAATLTAGRTVRSAGLVAQAPSLLVLPMAERTPSGLAGRLGAVLDAGCGHALVALDEGADAEEALPSALSDRLAFHLVLDGLRLGDCPVLDPFALPADPGAAVGDPIAPIVQAANAFGIGSLRAPQLTLAAARAGMPLGAADTVGLTALERAAGLVLAPRARQMPLPPDTADDDVAPPPASEPASPDPASKQEGPPSKGPMPQDLVLEAVRAVLPAGLLEALQEGLDSRSAVVLGQSDQGQRQSGNRRGRPLPSRPGKLGGDARLDLVATLRSAAPWQPLRRRQRPDAGHILVRSDDIRVRCYESRSDRALIFAVDASGSTALARLAEAKGAIETLLAQAYARRDHVALIAFRGSQAEILLPPTRSLVQTKRRLAALPGGGGTPLAAGLRAALDLGLTVRRRGMTPGLALLTDGRANIRLDGSPGRAEATAEAMQMARTLRNAALPAIVIDTAMRPQRLALTLAEAMAARYLPLPGADARRLSQAVSTALEA